MILEKSLNARIGIIARCDNTGLGMMTVDFFRNVMVSEGACRSKHYGKRFRSICKSPRGIPMKCKRHTCAIRQIMLRPFACRGRTARCLEGACEGCGPCSLTYLVTVLARRKIRCLACCQTLKSRLQLLAPTVKETAAIWEAFF